MSEKIYHVIRSGQSQNELRHWKYIKRYKVGDKWRYVYANKSMHKSINKDLGDAQRYRHDSDYWQKKSDKTYSVYERAKKYDVGTEETRKDTLKYSVRQMDTSFQYANAADRSEHRAISNILDNSVSSISKDLVDAGRILVDDLLKNLGRMGRILFKKLIKDTIRHMSLAEVIIQNGETIHSNT